jgi:hypothetical protein
LAPPCTSTSKKSERLGTKKPNPAEERAPYLEEEKARFLFLEASVDEAGAAGAPVAVPPDISAARASAARAGTSAARAAPVVDCLAAGAAAPAPGDAALAAGASSGDGGAGSHLSEGPCPPASSFSSSSEDEYSSVPGEESPSCSRRRYSSLRRSRRSRCRLARSLLRAARSCSRCCAARPSARESGVGGTDFAALKVTSCRRERQRRVRGQGQHQEQKQGQESYSPAGR